jgi:hypothetical protein
MYRAFSLACVLGVLATMPSSAADDPARIAPEEWISLFNGRDLSGWTPKIRHHELGDNHARTFRVENGILQVRYDEYTDGYQNRFGHLFYETPYSHYKLVIEYRFVGDQAAQGPGAWALRNSGVMLHSQAPKTMTREQDFPISIEAQFLGGLSDGKPRPTANMCSPGTEIVYGGSIYPEHCLRSFSKTYDGDQWVRAEILVLGDGLVIHSVNGEKVLEYSMVQIGGGVVSNHDPAVKKDGQPLASGYLALQSESHPIDFRRVELLNLVGCMDKKSAKYRSYYVRHDPNACR